MNNTISTATLADIHSIYMYNHTTVIPKLCVSYCVRHNAHTQFYGETCRVHELGPRGQVGITSKMKFWSFPTSFLVLHDDLASLPWSSPLPNTDNLGAFKNYLSQHPNQVHNA